MVYRMGKVGFLSFFVVLAEISSGVKEFFRNDGGLDAHGVPAKSFQSSTTNVTKALPNTSLKLSIWEVSPHNS